MARRGARQGTPKNRVAWRIGNYFGPGYVATADLNLNGNTDVCMVDWESDDQALKTHQGSGTSVFTADRSYLVPGFEGVTSQPQITVRLYNAWP